MVSTSSFIAIDPVTHFYRWIQKLPNGKPAEIFLMVILVLISGRECDLSKSPISAEDSLVSFSLQRKVTIVLSIGFACHPDLLNALVFMRTKLFKSFDPLSPHIRLIATPKMTEGINRVCNLLNTVSSI
jgi:hypothetical protein